MENRNGNEALAQALRPFVKEVFDWGVKSATQPTNIYDNMPFDEWMDKYFSSYAVENVLPIIQSPSLTKREYFAGLAMQGLLIRTALTESVLAQQALNYSDALLAKLAESEAAKP